MQTAPKKVINGWAMYDWANSVYSLVIATTFFPVYYTGITEGENFRGSVTFLGMTFVNTALYLYALSFTYLIVSITMPILSSIADYRGNKKRFMQFFCTLGALSCAGLYFFDADHVTLGVILMMLAGFGFYSSLVFYNSYLPEIAAEEDRDRISAKGFTFGYIGSVLMQLIGFVLVMFADKIPFLGTESNAVRFAFLLVGAWWLGFAQIAFARLPKGLPAVPDAAKRNIITGGFRELRKVFRQLVSMPVVKRFLFAFFFYNMGVQTVMIAATNFGSKVLKLESTKLIITIVLIQLVAIPGAFLMSKLSGLYGNLRVLAGVVLLWIAVCIAAYFMQTEYHFYIIAVVVGLVMGGIQSLSRSTYSKLMPVTKDTASFFSFYDVTEKVAIVIGLFAFAFIDDMTKNMRYSVLSLIIFFAIGLIGLIMARSKQKNSSEETSMHT